VQDTTTESLRCLDVNFYSIHIATLNIQYLLMMSSDQHPVRHIKQQSHPSDPGSRVESDANRQQLERERYNRIAHRLRTVGHTWSFTDGGVVHTEYVHIQMDTTIAVAGSTEVRFCKFT